MICVSLAILLLKSRKHLIEYVPGMLIVKRDVECVCVCLKFWSISLGVF